MDERRRDWLNFLLSAQWGWQSIWLEWHASGITTMDTIMEITDTTIRIPILTRKPIRMMMAIITIITITTTRTITIIAMNMHTRMEIATITTLLYYLIQSLLSMITLPTIIPTMDILTTTKICTGFSSTYWPTQWVARL